MVKLSELQVKEVIMIDDGRRIGHISDLEIDPDHGKILAIILIVKDKRDSLFSKSEELVIPWNRIVRIGSDVILVREVHTPLLYGNQSYAEKE
ncbi:YlmC/YmxH family sporulation protein [Virgibacillus xinjiangensis]|uniref:YlmC/YmxH family sporulation protein n=1 Tax=Virgibacillus xinjiangensis TaxID=393090 RepID=A0ABV7CUZ7_9BACI